MSLEDFVLRLQYGEEHSVFIVALGTCFIVDVIILATLQSALTCLTPHFR